VTEQLIPIFRIKDGDRSRPWYARLGFEVTGEHRFAPNLPLYLFLRRGDVQLHLSEHKGDAPKRSLAYFWVDDVDEIAANFGTAIDAQPWGDETTLIDPDGNRIRCCRGH
jgi:hypothetical protein